MSLKDLVLSCCFVRCHNVHQIGFYDFIFYLSMFTLSYATTSFSHKNSDQLKLATLIGIGNIIVEDCSVDIPVSVCRYLN